MLPGVPLVHSASAIDPMFGSGVFQPPKKRMTARNETKSIMPYSPIITKLHLSPEYSVWKPPTSSDSASGISKGPRFASAKEAMKKMIKAKKKIGALKMFQVNIPPISVVSIPNALIPNR